MICSKYNSGMLKEPIAIQRAAKVSDGAGGFSETWAALAGAPTRGAVKALSGSERYASESRRQASGVAWCDTSPAFWKATRW